MKLKKELIWLGISIVGFAILSISFLIMPVEGSVIATNIAGLLFWIGLIIGIIFQFLLVKQSKIEKTKTRAQRIANHRIKPGVFALFKNPVAIVFDCLMAVGLVGFISSMILTKGMGYICYMFISITVFAFSMHCIFNGRTYLYITCKAKKKNLPKEDIETVKEEH